MRQEFSWISSTARLLAIGWTVVLWLMVGFLVGLMSAYYLLSRVLLGVEA
jgi:hypothetical protein